jgi:hypothetical protein
VRFANLAIASIFGGIHRGALRSLLLAAFMLMNAFNGGQGVRNATDESEAAVNTAALDECAEAAEAPLESVRNEERVTGRIGNLYCHLEPDYLSRR